LSGGLLNSHIPSSAREEIAVATSMAEKSRSEIIGECMPRIVLMKSWL